ncbi:MAG TPA: deoxyribonuclease IV [Pirellulaceae bacterium]|mgnify:CR=1 FL=1|nr:deoxyribonuclease IV [Pirellulaceae bacterium]HMO92726.1 deoxyribonuclease IV [Pirellulaceae bacterium]HMP70278.1 deoxyribonuclease IV [Pirellulaceae bacterium]
MPLIGAHMSIAGGYYKSVELAAAAGCDCVQLFTKNNNQWRAKPISAEEARMFKHRLRELNISHPIAHSSYLINLASPDNTLRDRSIEAMIEELRRADQLGISGVVMHPGAYTTSSEEVGIVTISKSIDAIYDYFEKSNYPVKAKILLETTAGQGSHLGWRFEHLADIIKNCDHRPSIGVCLDTCHMFAAGYAMHDEQDYQSTIDKLLQSVGIRRIKAIHLNDSLKPFGSRLDRHAAIGEGEMGLEPFRHLLNDSRFAKVPMYLETPKGMRGNEDLDVINLRTLRGLISKRK